MDKGALDGVRVLEWADYHVGAHAATLLSDLGAEVIKLEPPIVGARGRGSQKTVGVPVAAPQGKSYFFEALNRGKKSVTVDLNKEKARQVVYRLVERSDVFLTNFMRRTILKFGMDYPNLRRYNPKLIYARASAFGPRGPDADCPGIDTQGQARSGIMFAMRSPDAVPFNPVGLGDQMGSISTAYGILAALHARDHLGIGQEVNTSILGGMVWVQTTNLSLKLLTGREIKPFDGRSLADDPLWNNYRTGDGKWLNISVAMRSQDFWPALCDTLGLCELEHDRRFDTPEKREENRLELLDILERAFAQRPRAEWLRVFKERGLLAAPVNTLSEAVEDPQILENRYIAQAEHPVFGPVKEIGCPVDFSETPARINPAAPELGEHTEEMLVEVGGYTWEEIAQLRDEGVI